MIWLALTAALATPFEVEVPWQDTFDPDDHDVWLEDAAARAPRDATSVRIVTRSPSGELVPLVDLLPKPAPTAPKEASDGRRSAPVIHPGRAEGFLTGRATYLSQCHGWIWYDSLDRFATQRGNNWDTVEDFHNPEGMNQFLSAYLENAGADVFMVKERDWNPAWALADNDGDQYTESGSGFETVDRGFALKTVYDYGDNPFEAGTSRRFRNNSGAVATWTPDVPEPGYYSVFVTWQSDSKNTSSAHYRITHAGGVIDRTFDQRVHGSNWRFVERLWLDEGTDGLKVELVGDGGDDAWVSADTVRVGGGMGLVRRNGETTERPRWEEGAILATQFNGAPSSVYDPYWDGDGSDPSSRSKWAEWEHPSGEDAIYLSWHSNAVSNGSARGTVTYYAGNECSNPAVTGSSDLSQDVQDELAAAFDTWWEPGWYDRGVKTACFSEVNPNLNDEMPATLVELAFHDNEEDAWYLKHPRFRQDASRAMYRGIVTYFAERDGVAPVFLPEPPTHAAARRTAEGLQVSWQPGPSGGLYGDAPSGYRVFTSADGRSWDNGTDVSGTSTVLDLDDGQTLFVRVAATNDGGISFPTPVVGARTQSSDSPVLIVDAFDRLDHGQLTTVQPGGGLGTVVRMNVERMNANDIVAAHGRAVSAAGWAWDAITDEALPDVDLSTYQLVIWAAGEESSGDETLSSDQQALLRSFHADGGALWVSGSEVLWDLDGGSADDQAFAGEVLGASLEADTASSTDVNGFEVLEGVGPMDFALEDGAPYPVDYPDALSSEREVIARYTSGEIAGVLGERVATFGFPFDTIGDPAVRDEVATRLLPALVPDYEPPLDDDPEGSSSLTDGRRNLSELKGCGCTSTGSGGAMGLLAVMLALFARRRSW